MICTLTCCKRVELFKETIRSFALLNDRQFITKIECFDDGSSVEEKLEMFQSTLPYGSRWHSLEGEQVGGHPNSMRKIWDFVTASDEQFFFHTEDDFPFIRSGAPLLAALDILLHDTTIGSVMLGREDISFPRQRRTPTGTAYAVRPLTFGADNLPAFTLNPAVHRVAAWRATGQFENVPMFEADFGVRFNKAGFRVTDLSDFFVAHKGEVSAYTLMERNR